MNLPNEGSRHAMDKRTLAETLDNFKKGKHNELVAVKGFVRHQNINHGLDSHSYEMVNGDDDFMDNRPHLGPDVFIWFGNVKRAVEIKTTKFPHPRDGHFYIKSNNLFHILSNPKDYPHPALLFVTPEWFYFADLNTFVREFPIVKAELFGGIKDAFKVDADTMRSNGERFILPLSFI